MSKRKSQLDHAIDALEEKKADILAKAQAEVTAIEHAILTLNAERAKNAQRTKRAIRPRPLASVGGSEKVG